MDKPSADEPVNGDATKANPIGGPLPGAARRDERAAKRYSCSGRAKLSGGSMTPMDGKMFDISRTGCCVMLENRVAMGASYTLGIAVFKAGKTHNFNVQARCVHATLVGNQGFKHGFEFERPNDDALKCIASLTETTVSTFT
jgi:hypothetical protein